MHILYCHLVLKTDPSPPPFIFRTPHDHPSILSIGSYFSLGSSIIFYYSILMFPIGSLFRMSLIATPCFFHSTSISHATISIPFPPHLVLLFSPHLYSGHLMIILPYSLLVLPSPWVLPFSFRPLNTIYMFSVPAHFLFGGPPPYFFYLKKKKNLEKNMKNTAKIDLFLILKY